MQEKSHAFCLLIKRIRFIEHDAALKSEISREQQGNFATGHGLDDNNVKHCIYTRRNVLRRSCSQSLSCAKGETVHEAHQRQHVEDCMIEKRLTAKREASKERYEIKDNKRSEKGLNNLVSYLKKIEKHFDKNASKIIKD